MNLVVSLPFCTQDFCWVNSGAGCDIDLDGTTDWYKRYFASHTPLTTDSDTTPITLNNDTCACVQMGNDMKPHLSSAQTHTRARTASLRVSTTRSAPKTARCRVRPSPPTLSKKPTPRCACICAAMSTDRCHQRRAPPPSLRRRHTATRPRSGLLSRSKGAATKGPGRYGSTYGVCRTITPTLAANV